MPIPMAGRISRIVFFALLTVPAAHSAPLAVRHAAGLLRGFLLLSSLDGKQLAAGDLSQVAVNDRVTNHLVFRFKDGSVHDETVVYSQRGTLRVLTYRLVQKGPSFRPNTELSFDCASGLVKVHTRDSDGKETASSDRMDIPPDVANGMILTLLVNFPAGNPPTTVSMLATTPKPRLVKIMLTEQGEDSFSLAGTSTMATHYVGKFEIGGVEGVLAKVLQKQPPDIHAWVVGGDAPGFVKMETALYSGGPVWRIELASPVWPRVPAAHAK